MLNYPTPDVPLLRKVLAWAETEATKPEPEREWDQSAWRRSAALRSKIHDQPCGTAYCIAGYTCHLDGREWDTDATGLGICLVDGRTTPAVARSLLGITKLEAGALFDANNTIDQLRRIAGGIAARAGDTL